MGDLMEHASLLTSLSVFGIFLFVTVLLFLICREMVTWYWKINEIVVLLARIERHLARHTGD